MPHTLPDKPHAWLMSLSTTLGAATYAAKAARLAKPDQQDRAARLECEWQRKQLPTTICELAIDDQRRRNDICWSVFDF